MTGEISSLLILTEGSERCSTGTSLSKSSYDDVANFSKEFAREILCPRHMSDLNTHELFKQFFHLLEVQDHFFASGLVGIFYLLYYQLGITAYLQLVSFHGVGEVKPCYNNLVFNLVIEGLEPEYEGVLYVDSVGRGQNQSCTTPLGVWRPHPWITSKWGGRVLTA